MTASFAEQHLGHRVSVATGDGYRVMRCLDCGVVDEEHRWDEAKLAEAAQALPVLGRSPLGLDALIAAQDETNRRDEERIKRAAAALDDEIAKRNEWYGLDNWATTEVAGFVLASADPAPAHVWVLTKYLAYEEEIVGIYATDDFMTKMAPREEWERESHPDELVYYGQHGSRYVAKRWEVTP